MYGLESIPLDARVLYRPQYTFIYDIDNDGKLLDKKVDVIIKYENLNDDIAKINKQYNLKIPQYGNEKIYTPLKYIKHFNKNSIQ